MRAMVNLNDMGGQVVEYLAAPAGQNTTTYQGGERGSNKERAFVTLEIQVAALRRLIRESKLSG